MDIHEYQAKEILARYGVAIAREFYLGFVLDRGEQRVAVVASREGGMDIEEIAEKKPDSLIRLCVEPAVGMQAFQARELAFALGLPTGSIAEATQLIIG